MKGKVPYQDIDLIWYDIRTLNSLGFSEREAEREKKEQEKEERPENSELRKKNLVEEILI